MFTAFESVASPGFGARGLRGTKLRKNKLRVTQLRELLYSNCSAEAPIIRRIRYTGLLLDRQPHGVLRQRLCGSEVAVGSRGGGGTCPSAQCSVAGDANDLCCKCISQERSKFTCRVRF